jgi:hypothetical protein
MFSTMDALSIARIVTGRDKRRSLEYIAQLEKEYNIANGEVQRLIGQLVRAFDDRQACYEELRRAGVNIAEPVSVNAEVRNFLAETGLIELPAAQAVPPPLPPEPQAAPLPKPAPPDKPAPASPASKRWGRKKINLSPEEFATWYNLVYEEFKVYPPDTIAAKYYGYSDGTIAKVRKMARAAGLITYTPTTYEGIRWKASGVTLADIVGRLGAR